MKPLAIITVLALPASAAYGQQSTFTDSAGRYSGSAFQRGNSTSFSDRRGDFAGSAITRDHRTDFYDARGRYQGTITRPPATGQSR
jgi:hypothetical protein